MPPDRLRRRLIFHRVVARLRVAEPGRWVVKGGMAMEARIGNRARLTKDLDLGARDTLEDAVDLRDGLIDALVPNHDNDRLTFAVSAPQRLGEDGAGTATWRLRLEAELAGKQFGSIKLDVSPRGHELDVTEVIVLPNMLDFAGVPPVEVEVVDVHRHAAEKFHAMFKDFGDRENSRVRDLVDLMLMDEQELIALDVLADAVRRVWIERDGAVPPVRFPELPGSWPSRYERIADENGVEPRSFVAANERAAVLWREMFPTEEK